MEKKQLPATIKAAMGTGLVLNTIEDLQRAAKLFIASGIFAERDVERDMAKVCVKLIAGQELGLKPFQAMRGIDIVQGQPTFRYQLVGAKIKQSKRYDFRPVEVSAVRAAIQFFDGGVPVYLSEFTMEDAKAQGLANKDGYKKMPADMLYARALTKGANKVCPEIFFVQCYAPEDFGEASGEMLHTEADIAEVIAPVQAWKPSQQDWVELRAEVEAAGADMLEFQRFIDANKGKGLGAAGIFLRTKELFLGEHANEHDDTAERERELDDLFHIAIDND